MKKRLGVKTCTKILAKDRAKYKKEEEEAQYISKKKGWKWDTQAHIEHLVPNPHPSMVVDYRPRIQGVEQYQISLTKVVGMTWMQKCSSFSMHVAYHSMFLSHTIGMKW